MLSRHAAACGISIGLLTGIAITILLNLDIEDALYRTAVLAIGGAWMGVLLAYLNDLLRPSHARTDGREKHLP